MNAEHHIRPDPMISYVVIGRNEENAIGKCIESVLQSSRGFDSSEIVFVDSHSTDSTVEIATKYPIFVLGLLESQSASPAAGRTIGTQFSKGTYIMYVDGDMILNPQWTGRAVSFMESNSDFGAVFGRLVFGSEPSQQHDHGEIQPSFPGVTHTEISFKTAKRIPGAALIRRSSLDLAGGLNPHLTGDEEAELSYRICAHGFKIGSSDEVMAIHPSRRNSTLEEAWRRFRNGYFKGQGRVLITGYRHNRAAFRHHLWRLKRYLIYFTWFVSGFLWFVLSALTEKQLPFLIWLAVSIGGIVIMAVKYGFRDTLRRLLSSMLVGFGFLQAVFQRVPSPDDFPKGFVRIK